ncbi:M48 family metallopeptidase [Salinisphaera sp. P385]|uniref:M48 family metallopeptidase n=1 Tax=Spectribacter acetivorans TaxID=3075603 RepID=A0ABU3B4V6_9GAMM|nr:M48 family metallopeptidase [Salinisphaera sp. P385]MDT0617497.1 M48 family metallopeptidase [Salinisphaera sp. P385]
MAAVLLPFLAACDQTPTGRNQLALVPEPIMRDLGQDAFEQMKQGQTVVTDATVRTRVECIAGRIVEAAGRQYPQSDAPGVWEIVVFENDTPNAFALPGGRIGIHTGVLEVAETSGQLAAIIGHEVGHLLANHGNERLTQQLGIKAGMVLIGMFGEIESQQLLQALGIGAQLGIVLPFSRAHEREADQMGLQLMAAAGFPPAESVELWRNMARQAGDQPMEFLSTHPGHESRINMLKSQLDTVDSLYRQAQPADC